MRAVHFGAGNIGRGFIGLLLSRAGYEVCFVDVNASLVDLLRERGQYTVTLANAQADAELVRNVTAVNGTNLEQVAEAIAGADLVTTAVGVSVLKHIAPSIAQGIRVRLRASAAPLPVIACENAIGGSTQLKEQVYAHLTPEDRVLADGLVAFPDAAVDRIVPLQHHEDPLQVTVEPFYEWVVDRSAMPSGFQEIAGVHYVEKLEPYIERKLFTVNTGHCCAAYHGYLAGCSTIQEAMSSEAIRAEVASVLQETGAMLVRKFGFDAKEHETYAAKIMDRFTNPYIDDEVVRVGRSPIRKLSPNDRLVRPALLAHELGMEVPHLAAGMAAALLFDYPEDQEAAAIQALIAEHGIHHAIETYTGLPGEHPIHQNVYNRYEALKLTVKR
ncbi:mannitol-1-phosphate 5-dehydrogenase [Paenibacillus validus]|uniref:mannitol-1-phosphate 5-dehydrogenase n=1 Tax=Paenibacillus TaxID=44249 RepID=UPI000FD88C55|nr:MULTISPECIES: mannitol-1-phosphate 5-dehydrogenase [Paenibacillus]MED4604062.1 mannitol-1-phosphate 5-dehydrogenase [Paenibacillus validus]MED4606067.1 mannitol-1-phosphate 5-dehydrogenase [Paenibacillus validus]